MVQACLEIFDFLCNFGELIVDALQAKLLLLDLRSGLGHTSLQDMHVSIRLIEVVQDIADLAKICQRIDRCYRGSPPSHILRIL